MTNDFLYTKKLKILVCNIVGNVKMHHHAQFRHVITSYATNMAITMSFGLKAIVTAPGSTPNRFVCSFPLCIIMHHIIHVFLNKIIS